MDRIDKEEIIEDYIFRCTHFKGCSGMSIISLGLKQVNSMVLIVFRKPYSPTILRNICWPQF